MAHPAPESLGAADRRRARAARLLGRWALRLAVAVAGALVGVLLVGRTAPAPTP